MISALKLLKAHNLNIYEIGKQRSAYDGSIESDNWPAKLKDPVALQKMVDVGFGSLRKHQWADGGWSWFHFDEESPYLTSIVLLAMCDAIEIAPTVGLSLPVSEDVKHDILHRAASYLLGPNEGTQVDEALLARSYFAAARALSLLPKTDEYDEYKEDRELLNTRLHTALAKLGSDKKSFVGKTGGSAGMASLIMAMKLADRDRDAKYLLQSLIEEGFESELGGTAFPTYGSERTKWHDTEVEAQALAVQAIAMVEPDNKVLAAAVRNLMIHKKGSGWGNTRASGQAIQALACYLTAVPEQAEQAAVDIILDGSNIGTFKRSGAKLLSGRTRWDVKGGLTEDSELILTRSGKAAISGSVTIRAFMPVDDDFESANNGISVQRSYRCRTAVFKKVEVEVQNTRGNVVRRFTEQQIRYTYESISKDTVLKVGDIVSVQLYIVAPKGQRYMCIEDARPSCLEPIANKWGQRDMKGRLEFVDTWTVQKAGLQVGDTWVSKKEHDTVMNFFVEEFKGKSILTIEYDCVVVAGGKFTAMPARAFDMYDESRNGHTRADVFTVK